MRKIEQIAVLIAETPGRYRLSKKTPDDRGLFDTTP